MSGEDLSKEEIEKICKDYKDLTDMPAKKNEKK